MDKLKMNFSMSCISFTWVLLFLSFIHIIGITKNTLTAMPMHSIFELYLMCVLVQVLIYFSNKLPIENSIVISIIQILDVFLIVIPFGLYFDFFDLTFKQIFLVSIICFTAYIVVTFTTLIKSKIDASYINSKISKKRSE